MRRSSLFTRCNGYLVVALLAAAAVASAAWAQAPPDPSTADELAGAPDLPEDAPPERSKLTGDWFGWRSGFQDHGVTFEFSTTQYYQGTASGGLEQAFNYGGRNDYFLNMEGEKLGLWQGA